MVLGVVALGMKKGQYYIEGGEESRRGSSGVGYRKEEGKQSTYN